MRTWVRPSGSAEVTSEGSFSTRASTPAVPSLEQSSTTTSSFSSGTAATRRSTSRMSRSSLKTGMTIDSFTLRGTLVRRAGKVKRFD